MIKIAQKIEQTLEHKTECLILTCLEEKKPTGGLKKLNDTVNGAISSAFESKRFSGKPEQTLLFNSPWKASNLLLVVIGKSKDVTGEKICRVAATAVKLAEKSKFKSISADLSLLETLA